jgi:signal transduction histidine kinase
LRQFARPGGPDVKRVERSLGALERESEKLSHLVVRLLDLSRIGSGQLALDRTPTDIASLVRELAANTQLTTSQHTIAVRAPASVQALVDPLRLEQVITNLLSNAIKYSPRGGPIDIEVATPDPGTVCIGVRDHGVGIPADRQQRLFERFYQTRTGDRIAGLGLGLYISRQIVTLHGGHIGVESPPDGGTRFTVCLPTSPVDRKVHEGLGT